ncbi:MAG: hypothetical protein KGS72_26895, partial [Cyanobacteria bacterium REEB67]|nr:hypothetical protein [Cyanobacteria bacterium REEB67]
MPAALILRNRLAFVICLLTLVPNVYRLAPLFDVGARVQPPINSQSLALLAFNCENRENHNPGEIFKIIKASRPDFLCLCEINAAWAKLIETELPEYPFKTVYASYPGVAFLSKLPFEKSE